MNRFISLVIAIAAYAASATAQTGIPFNVERTGEGSWRITITNSAPYIGMYDADSIASLIKMPGHMPFTVAGSITLPMKRFWFPAQGNTTLNARIVSLSEQSQTIRLNTSIEDPFSSRVAPTPIPGSNGYLTVGSTHTIDGLRKQSLNLVSARYNPATSELHWVDKMVVEVFFSESAGFDAARADLDEIDQHIAAYNLETDAYREWFAPGATMLKILTPAEGVYRVSYQDVVAAGAPVASMDPSTFKLYLDGHERAIIVHSAEVGRFQDGDYIEFYAPRKVGEAGEYFSEWADENVFWLAWGGAGGKRAQAESAAPSSGTAISTIPTLRHFEQDRSYHAGDSDEWDGTFTDKRPGETWVWKYIIRDSSFTVSINLPDVVTAPAYIVSSMKKSSSHGSKIRLSVNGTTIKEFSVDNGLHGAPLPIKDTALVSPSIFRQGINTVTYHSIGSNPPGDNIIERVYLDAFDVYYQSDGSVEEGAFALQPGAYGLGVTIPDRFRATIAGFPSETIRAVNVGSGDTLSGMEISKPGNSAQATFAVPSAQGYYFYTTANIGSPARISLQTMTEYGTENSGTDYIIVTHDNFLNAAQRLANFRQSVDGYRTLIATVDDVYNEFNHGHKHPVAIKRFMMKAYGTWKEPKPAFLTLLGDASWDPKFLQATSIKEDFVPAFGHPVSDTYYITIDSSDVYPLMHIGRIPCETSEAGDDFIDKVIEYESAPPADWQNRFLITAGGINFGEFDIFRNINEYFIHQYLLPHCLEPERIYKKNPSLVGYDDIDSIITHVNRGVLWLNFVGHGGSRIIDIGLERPDIFDVQGKYHIFSTLSCNTAHYAEPHETGLNEKFAMSVRNGAIGSIGTSGLGYLSRDQILGNEMFDALVSGNAKTFGAVLTLGKRGLATAQAPSQDWISRNTILQVTYLGDPATRIPIETLPELAIEAENISTVPEILIQNAQTQITSEFQNYGFCMNDTVTARLRLLTDDLEIHTAEKMIPPFAEAYTVEWPVSIGTVSGAITIEVEIDTENLLVERTKVNNKIRIERNVLRRGVTPVFPHNNTIVSLSSPEHTFLVANPSVVPLDAGEVTVEIQIAMNPDFSAPVISKSRAIGTVFTWFENVTDVTTDGVYYWRGRMLVDGIPEDWSPAWSFTAQPSASDESYVQTERSQLATALRTNIDLAGDATMRLGTTDVSVTVFSAANNQSEIDNLAQIIVNGVDQAPNSRGFNAVVLHPKTGTVVERALFDTYEGATEVTNMINFLKNIPDDHYLALAIHDDANGWWGEFRTHTNLTPELQNELKRFGSTLFDEGYPDVWWHISYAMFGRRSEPERTRQEVNNYGAAFFRDTITVQAVQGTVRSSLAGPANNWGSFRWNGSKPTPESRVDLAVYSGTSATDSVLLQQSGVQPDELVSLAPLGSTNPFVHFQLTLHDTTTVSSPVVTGWSASFVSQFPELGITNQVVDSAPDSVLEGSPITIQVQVYNAGRTDALNVPVFVRTPLNNTASLTPIIIPRIPAGKDSYEEFTYDIQTAGLVGSWNANIEVARGNAYPEYYKGNNLFPVRFISGKDNIRPELIVLFDGMPIVDLDFVSPTPVIEISLLDNSSLPVTDTSSMQIFLDGRRIWLNGNPQLNYVLGSSGEEKFTITYTPELRPGIRTLSISGKDADGNAADSIPYQVRFQVKTENLVDQIFPVPNPSQGPMHFTFRIIGSTPPESGTIKIYTIAGRLIHEIEIHESALRIGFNRIPWNGRDQDGDMLANGVYFYKLILKRGEGNQEFLGKVAILR